MLNAIRGERGDAAVVEPDGQHQDHRALGVPEAIGDEVGDLGELECVLELVRRLPVERGVPLERGRRMHRCRAGHGGRVLLLSAPYPTRDLISAASSGSAPR